MAIEGGGGYRPPPTPTVPPPRIPYPIRDERDKRDERDRGKPAVPIGWKPPEEKPLPRPTTGAPVPYGWNMAERVQREYGPTQVPIVPVGWDNQVGRWMNAGLGALVPQQTVNDVRNFLRGLGNTPVARQENQASRWLNAVSGAFGIRPLIGPPVPPGYITPRIPGAEQIAAEQRQFRDTGYHGRGSPATNPYYWATYPTVPPPTPVQQPTFGGGGYGGWGWGGGGGGGGGYGGGDYDQWLKSLLTRWNY